MTNEDALELAEIFVAWARQGQLMRVPSCLMTATLSAKSVGNPLVMIELAKQIQSFFAQGDAQVAGFYERLVNGNLS